MARGHALILVRSLPSKTRPGARLCAGRRRGRTDDRRARLPAHRGEADRVRPGRPMHGRDRRAGRPAGAGDAVLQARQTESGARETVRLFSQELLDQELREPIADETSAVRSLILAPRVLEGRPDLVGATTPDAVRPIRPRLLRRCASWLNAMSSLASWSPIPASTETSSRCAIVPGPSPPRGGHRRLGSHRRQRYFAVHAGIPSAS